MVPPGQSSRPFAPCQRWDVFEQEWGDRIRAADAAAARKASPTERLAIVDDLLETVRAAHESAGTWATVDERAWRETLAERRRIVVAFQKHNGAAHGYGAPSDLG